MKKTKDSAGALPFEAAKDEETLPLLQSGVPRSARLQCWSPGRTHTYTSRIVKVHEASGLVLISVSKEVEGGEAFESAMMRETLGECLFSLHLPTDVIFFKGEIRKGDAELFHVRVKTPLYKVQRRESLRLPVPGNGTVHIRLPGDKEYIAELQNVSEGGIGAVFRERAVFKAVSGRSGNVSLSFTAFGIAVTAEAAVKHGAEFGTSRTGKVYRLGFAFTQIDPKTRTQLSQLVLEESAKYLGRF